MAYMTQEELHALHGVLLEMMRAFDALCREHNIQYFLGGGTLLGAIRHRGFIPWDDDVDLMMTRENYNKLCSLPREAFPPELFLQTYRTDSAYHGDMAKIRLNGTVYSTEFSSNFPDMHQGIFIDIFAHDRTSASNRGQKLHIFLTTLARSMVFHKWEGTPMQYYGKHKVICAAVTLLIKALPIRWLENFRERIFRFFENSGSGMLYDGMGMHLSHGAFPEAWLNEAVEVELSGHLFPAPKEYHRYLTYSYGDYNTLPSESERRCHKIHHLDFGGIDNKNKN